MTILTYEIIGILGTCALSTVLFFLTRKKLRDEGRNDPQFGRREYSSAGLEACVVHSRSAHPRPNLKQTGSSRLRVKRRSLHTSSLVEPHSSCCMEPDGLACDLLQPAGWLRHSPKGALPVYCFAFLVSVAFFLIADIDSPRTGVIRVAPRT
jgi:hypothetical protein